MNDAGPDIVVDDAAAREAALDPVRSFIVQAPAGSGKTELLTQRYLRLLARVNKPEEILALTFTRKAAAEMRRRIVEALRRARDEGQPTTAHERKTWQLAREALERDRARDWQLLDNPGRLFVRTIDALCTYLVRQMPVLSRSGAVPAITEEPERLYRAAARTLLSAVDDDDETIAPSLETLLTHLDNDLGEAEKLLAQMLAGRDRWLPLLGATGQRAPLEQALRECVDEHLAALRARIPADCWPELVELAAGAAERLSRAGTESAICACRALRKPPAATADDIETWRGLAELLLTQQDRMRRTVNVGVGFPPPSGGKTDAEKGTLADAKERMLDLMSRLGDDPTLVALIAGARHLPPVRYTTAQWAVIQALLQVLPRAVAELKVRFGEAGVVDFAEMMFAAQRALGTPDEPTDLALRFDYRIGHILVDEFQDTSAMQYDLLGLLTAGWEASDGRTLFLVGDPMQSIYRFRKAEVGLFLSARERGLDTVRPEPLHLSCNFRSQGGLVDWFNAAFTDAFPAAEDAGDGAVTYAASAPFIDRLDGDAVVVHPANSHDPAAEAQAVVTRIRAIRDVDPDASVAVLVRARTHLADIAPALKTAGLSFRAVEIERLGQRQAVLDVDALTRALNHLADRGAWLAVLRAPWCGLALADLHRLAAETSATIWERVQDDAVVNTLDDDGRTRILRVREILARALATRGRRRLRTVIEGTWIALGGHLTLVDAGDRDNVRAYFDLVERVDRAGDLPGLAYLSEALQRLHANPDPAADENLQVMTIHKAKGLEFDYVLLPGLHRASGRPKKRLLDWLETRDGAHATRLVVAPVDPRGETDPIRNYVRIVDKRRETYEQLRLLYVATTRARRELNLFAAVDIDAKTGLVSPPAAGTLLVHLWPAVKPMFDRWLDAGAPTPDTPRAAAGATGAVLRRLTADTKPPAFPDAAPWVGGGDDETEAPVTFQWASETARQVGNVVHRTMQEIARTGPENWAMRWLDGLQQHFRHVLAMRGLLPADLDQAAERAAMAIERALADERGRWIVDPDHADARSEYAVTGWLDGRIVNAVMDRTFVDDDGVRWVIDFKTGSHEGGTVDGFMDNEVQRYRGQLDRYARLMALLDDRPVRVALYFPLLQGWREWTP